MANNRGKVPCDTFTCHWHSKGYCTFKPKISHQKCVNFKENVAHYICLFFAAMNGNIIPSYDLTDEVRIGIYYAMNIYKISMSGSSYGDWNWVSFYAKEDIDREKALTMEDILERPTDNDELTRLENLLLEGKLPPFEDEAKKIQEEKEKKEKQKKEILKKNPDLEEMEYGFLTPEGKFIEADFGDHEGKALEICIALWPNEFNLLRGKSAVDFIVEEKGYALIHNPYGWGHNTVQVSKKKNLTKKQINFLYNYYFAKGEYDLAEKVLQEYQC